MASTGGAGHFGPLLALVDGLMRRGDDLLLVVPPALAVTAEATGLQYRVGEDPPEQDLAPMWERFATVPPDEAAVIANREIFGRLNTAAMLPTMRSAVCEYRPQLVLREPCEYASAVTAEEQGVPHVQVAISLAEVEASSLKLVAPVLRPYRPDLPERLLAAPYLTRFPASLDPSPFATTLRFQERAQDLPAEPLPGWWNGEDGPLVYLTLGTVAGALPGSAEVYRAALEAVGSMAVRVLLTTGSATDLSELGLIPANVHVETWVPQRQVLDGAAAVLCHGGSGTTFGALAAGVPLVIVPMFADQPVNGRLVASAGAGLLVDSAGAAAIRAALERVLDRDSYRRSAAELAAEIRALPDIDELLRAVAPPQGLQHDRELR